MNASEIITSQKRAYPALTATDGIKALYQAVFGCGHLVKSDGKGLERLKDEIESMGEGPDCPTVEYIGEDYARAHLRRAVREGLKAETLFRLFSLSSEMKPGSAAEFEEGIKEFKELCLNGDMGIDADDIDSEAEKLRLLGYPPVSHSPGFRRLYRPAYRVISGRFAKLLSLFSAIDRAKEPKIIAVDGRCASGKTTLARTLSDVYGCGVYHMDDFFLRPVQRTPERLNEPGGNVDRERFLAEVLKPLKKGDKFAYRPYDCSKRELGGEVRAVPGKISVVEGAYSLHPELEGYYSLKVFVTADREKQLARILRRDGADMLERFESEWIPMEEKYFAATDILSRCDIIIDDGRAAE